jgi:hypothetical protein
LELDLLGEKPAQIIFKLTNQETEIFEKTLDLPESGKSLLEFSNVESIVSVEVHSLEDNGERADANSTTLLDGKLELEVQLADHNIHVNTVESHV